MRTNEPSLTGLLLQYAEELETLDERRKFLPLPLPSLLSPLPLPLPSSPPFSNGHAPAPLTPHNRFKFSRQKTLSARAGSGRVTSCGA